MFKKVVALLLVILAIYMSFYTLMPRIISDIDTPDDQFSAHRALIHLKEISKKPHYLGSTAHDDVKDYIISEMRELGLEVETQTDYDFSYSSISKPTNIIAKIKGSSEGKALLLLTHYDSQPHSSYGASDAGSGVVTILESVRAFLNINKTPKNDIFIMFSDAEELGLNGANLFVNKHPWAKNIGLVLNFEARGSGGPSIMLVETNQGNANLIKAFAKAKPNFPLGNSLFYSIYKMLPNDTDLTRFREGADIDGFNFAFVDDHFDYHTALDTYARLDRNTLEHQGSYLMPLLAYFSEADLENLKSNEDYVYFNFPVLNMVIYPFKWIFTMLIIGVLAFIVLVFYGFKKRALTLPSVGYGFLAFLSVLISCGLLGFLGWKFLLWVYPQYSEMLHGFTYNGHTYILAFACLAIAICFMVYSKVYKPENAASLMVAPLLFWLVICAAIAFKLEGASFLIIPVCFGLFSFFVILRQRKPNLILMALIAFPALIILSPMVQMFPVGLGLKLLMASTVLVVLIYGLTLPVFAFFRHKKRLGYVFCFLGLYYLISAHMNSDFTTERPKPNSLVYMLDADTKTAKWATYDGVLDEWTSTIFDGAEKRESSGNTLTSKYKTQFQLEKKAEYVGVPVPKIEVTLDTIINNSRKLDICVMPQRPVQRIECFTNEGAKFSTLKVNGLPVEPNTNGFVVGKGKSNRLFTYYVTKNEPLDLQVSLVNGKNAELIFYEASYDLLDNKLLNVEKRYAHMIPKPFVLNDAVIVKKTMQIN